MRISPTLTWYFGKHVLLSILAILALLIGLIMVGDSIELLRRAGGKPDATVSIVFQMAASRIPFMTEKVLPFAVLFGSMFSFWKLTGNQELVVTRAAGVSAWQFLLPPFMCALILGRSRPLTRCRRYCFNATRCLRHVTFRTMSA